jgi:hypothetical protein
MLRSVQVLGNVKSAGSAVVSVMIFQNPVSLYGCLGFGIAILGSFWYAQSRRIGDSSASVHRRAVNGVIAEIVSPGSANMKGTKRE